MNERFLKNFRSRLDRGECVIGPFVKSCDPAFVEAAGWSGMDFVILDMEHGPISVQSLQNNIRAAQVSGIFPIVRVPDISESSIGKALDVGAAAIELPQVSCAADAETAVKLSRFFPLGERGVCRFVRAAHYSSQDQSDYFHSANEILLIAQLEGADAIRNIDEILKVPGIDIIFIGPYDLSQSLGLPGQVAHPAVIRQMRLLVEAAKKKHKIVGAFADSRDLLELWIKSGVQYIAYSVDVGIFTNACRDLKEAFKHMTGSGASGKEPQIVSSARQLSLRQN